MNVSLETKTCSKCSKTKAISEFAKSKIHSSGAYSSCKQCKKAYTDAAYAKNPYHGEDTRLRRTYKISLEDYNNLFTKQNGCCAICKIDQQALKKKLFVDHCHKTSKVRGLLCHKCNFAIGLLSDSTDLLAVTIKYLQGVSLGA